MITHIIIAAAAIIVILFAIIFFIRINNIKINSNKAEQFKELNNDLKSAGFAYDYKNDYFYSLRDCWQREAGYCRMYDEGALLFNMVMDCEPIEFSYAGKRWLIELWKGQYGITTGAEIGIYNTTLDDIHSDRFTGTFYEPISDNEQLCMSFILFRNGKKLFQRADRHWWLTAFKLGEFSEKDSLAMNVKIKFPSKDMCKAFVDALIGTGYTRREFSVNYKTVSIKYTVPHSPQPNSKAEIQEKAVQLVNRNNCKAYHFVTAKYSDTLDKLDFLKSSAPELYDFMLHSLYAKEFFKSFEWIIKLIHKHREKDDPETSCPIDPPKPPCPPSCEPPKPPCEPPKPPCPPSCEPPKPPCEPPKPPCPPSCEPPKPPCNNPCNGKDICMENEINIYQNNSVKPPQFEQNCRNKRSSCRNKRRCCRKRVIGNRADFLGSQYNGDYEDDD